VFYGQASARAEHVMAKSAITDMSNKAAALTTEAAKIVGQGALGAAQRAVTLARKTVQSADHALHGTMASPKPRKRRRTAGVKKVAATAAKLARRPAKSKKAAARRRPASGKKARG
jgi:hypothetical protein